MRSPFSLGGGWTRSQNSSEASSKGGFLNPKSLLAAPFLFCCYEGSVALLTLFGRCAAESSKLSPLFLYPENPREEFSKWASLQMPNPQAWCSLGYTLANRIWYAVYAEGAQEPRLENKFPGWWWTEQSEQGAGVWVTQLSQNKATGGEQ